MPFHLTDPQLGPALALVALRTENPHLPAAKWHVGTDGHLMVTVYDPDVFALYAEVLGGEPMAPIHHAQDGVVRESLQLFTTWQDVEVSLWGTFIAGVVPSAEAVAA